MTTELQDTVLNVVQEFLDKDELFTALDVSNKVKTLMPHTTHRSVRDEVRAIFATEIEPCGYARTPITVTLANGSQQQALLYHPSSDTFDLDNLYDQQKRAQVAFRYNPSATANGLTLQPQVSNVTATTATPTPNAATVTVSATASVPMPTARDLWKQLFATQPSLFPTK